MLACRRLLTACISTCAALKRVDAIQLYLKDHSSPVRRRFDGTSAVENCTYGNERLLRLSARHS
jgi:hypothetical protein